MVIDYRRLNAITIKDRYPLSNIEEMKNKLTGAQWFIKIDLRDAFHGIRMAEGEEWKTVDLNVESFNVWHMCPCRMLPQVYCSPYASAGRACGLHFFGCSSCISPIPQPRPALRSAFSRSTFVKHGRLATSRYMRNISQTDLSSSTVV